MLLPTPRRGELFVNSVREEPLAAPSGDAISHVRLRSDTARGVKDCENTYPHLLTETYSHLVILIVGHNGFVRNGCGEALTEWLRVAYGPAWIWGGSLSTRVAVGRGLDLLEMRGGGVGC